MKSSLARYPTVYSKILLSVPLDGTPLSIPLNDPLEAARERLAFYNFLKFVRRNQRECAHLHADNRANTVSISLQGSVLHFAIKGAGGSSLESAFAAAASGLNIPADNTPLAVAPDESNSFDPEAIDFGDEKPVANPMETFLNGLKGGAK